MPASNEAPVRGERYFAWLYAPAPQRDLLAALFGIEREIRHSLRPGLDHQIAHSRLQWWREELARCAQGQPRHPLTISALAVAREAGSLAAVSGLTDICLWDLANATFDTRRELADYAQRWSAAILGPLARLEAPEGLQWNVQPLGASLCELEFLDTLVPQARAGRVRVPLDELEHIGARPEQLLHPPWPAALTSLLAQRHERLRQQMLEACQMLEPAGQLAMRGLLVWSALAWRRSRRAQKRLPRPSGAEQRDALADAWYAWRAARRASAQRFRLH